MRLICLLLCFSFSLCWAQTGARQDLVLQDMALAFKKGDSRALTRLLPAAKGHLLEPWAAYFELRARLDLAEHDEVLQFFKRYANTYVEDRLRADWLLLLGARRDWTNFATVYPAYRMGDEKDISCYAVHADFLRTGQMNAGLVQQVERDWMSQQGVNTACGYIARNLIEAGLMPKIVAWRKDFPAEPSNRSNSATKKAFEQALVPRNDWSQEQKNWALGVQGRRMAMNHDIAALATYGRVSNLSDLSDEQLAWWVRALLRVGDWRKIETVIDAMSATYKSADAAWTFWQANAKQNLKKTAEAQALWQSIAFGSSPARMSFYEQMALEALGKGLEITAVPVAPAVTPQERRVIRANAGLQRALYAIDMGLRSEGVREWNYETSLATVQADGTQGMSDRERVAAAEWACERAIWDRCINTSERTKSFIHWQQRYPTPYLTEMRDAAQVSNVDLTLLLGLIRQESRFQVDAKSVVGASGLMQLMPATAKWTAKQAGLTSYSPSELNAPTVNLLLGSTYLRHLLNDFENTGAAEASAALAIAGYNAGPGRARAWRDNLAPDVLPLALVWVENIPFNETRDYVKKVVSNTKIYNRLLNLAPRQSFLGLSTSIPVKNKNSIENKELP